MGVRKKWRARRAREIRKGRESYLFPRVSPSHAPVLSCGIGNLQKKSCCTYARAELLFCSSIFLLCLICSRNKAEEDDSPLHFIIIIDMLQGGKWMFFSCHVMSVQMCLRGFFRLNSGCKGVIILISNFPFLILTSPTRRQSSFEFFSNFSWKNLIIYVTIFFQLSCNLFPPGHPKIIVWFVSCWTNGTFFYSNSK